MLCRLGIIYLEVRRPGFEGWITGTILDLDILEGLASKGDPQNAAPMHAEGESSSLMTKAVQAPPDSVAALPLLTIDMSPFEVLADRPLESVGAPSHFLCLVFAQHIVSSFVAAIQPTVEVPDIVRHAKEAFHSHGCFKVDSWRCVIELQTTSFSEEASDYRGQVLETDAWARMLLLNFNHHRPNRSSIRSISPGYEGF